MNKIITLILMCTITMSYGQSLPFYFESGITTSDFTDFDGGVATVIPNPQSSGINTSATVVQIVRNGGAIWSGSKVILASNLDFSTDNVMSMKVYTTAPVGTVVKLKVESSAGSDERDVTTTVSGAWEMLTWDFTGVASNFNEIVFMFDYGNVGDGSANSTFLFDDVEQSFGGSQIDVPVTFEDANVNYTTTDFYNTMSSLVTDPVDANNHVIQVIKPVTAGSSAGTTIGTPAGFATNLPLILTDSKMNVRVWSPDAGIPVRLKVENSNDATQTCETQVNTTVAGAWETLEFDFANEAAGTAALNFGLQNGWTYNMASIFFNFGTDGAAAGEKTYYFDDVKFGADLTNATNLLDFENLNVFPNPTNSEWRFTSEGTEITSIEVFDLQGKRLVFVEPNNHNVVIKAMDFVEGIYIAKITTDLGSRSLKLVKQ
ncbi:MAG: T9SS type A sorting domain-containing protein [Saprospiraceae bacterium]